MKTLRASTWGLQYGLVGRGQIGALTDQQRLNLQTSIEPAYEQLDLAQGFINDMNAAGLDLTQAVVLQQQIDVERSRLDTLASRIPSIENDADVSGWQQEVAQAFRSASVLESRAREAAGVLSSSRLWTVGLWTGAAVIGAIGSVFLIRRLGKTRFFKRLFRRR